MLMDDLKYMLDHPACHLSRRIFEYRSDTAIFHGAFISLLEQLRQSEKEEHSSRVDLCGLSDEDAIEPIAVIVKAVHRIEQVQENIISEETDNIRKRLLECLSYLVLRLDGRVNIEETYYEAVEGIFPDVDWNFYFNLLAALQWSTYFVESVSAYEDYPCIVMMVEMLSYVRTRNSTNFAHCIQAVVLKKYSLWLKNVSKVDPCVVYHLNAILDEATIIFWEVWSKHQENNSVTELVNLFSLSLLTLQTMCECIVEQLVVLVSLVPTETIQSRLSGMLEWYRVVISHLSLIVTQAEVILEPKQQANCEYDWNHLLESVGASYDLLKMCLQCLKRCGILDDDEGVAKLNTVCKCLLNIKCQNGNASSETSVDYILEELEKLDNLRIKIISKSTSIVQQENYFFGDLCNSVEVDTLCRLMNHCLALDNEDKENIIELFLNNVYDRLSLTGQQNILMKRLEVIGTGNDLKITLFDQTLTTLLNQATVDRPNLSREVIKLGLQSPEETLKRILMQATTYSGRAEISVQMLQVLYPVCSLCIESSSTTLLLKCLKEIFSGTLTEKEFHNIATTVNRLISADEEDTSLSSLYLVKTFILPSLSLKSSQVVRKAALLLLQHVCKTKPLSKWVDGLSLSSVVACLCQLIDLHAYEGNGASKEHVIQVLSTLKDVFHKTFDSKQRFDSLFVSLSPVGRLSALQFFDCIISESKFPLYQLFLGGCDNSYVAKSFSEILPHVRYPLLVAIFVQVLPHATVQEWEATTSLALGILSCETVLEYFVSQIDGRALPCCSESLLVRCVSDALMLVFKKRRAPIVWNHVFFCYSLLLKRLVSKRPECRSSIFCEACRLTSLLSKEVADFLVIPLLELIRGVSTNRTVCAVVESIVHDKIRRSLLEVS